MIQVRLALPRTIDEEESEDSDSSEYTIEYVTDTDSE